MATEKTAEWRLITPALAESWLKLLAPYQRPENVVRLKKYVQELREGRWTDSENAIAFQEDGFLVNGRHRLRAIVITGISVEMLVATGLRQGSYKNMDCPGASRTAGDGLDPALANRRDLSTCARHLYTRRQGVLAKGRSVSNSLVDETFEKHRELVLSYEKFGKKAYATESGFTRTMLATMHYECSLVAGAEKADEYFNMLVSGVGLDVGHPALAARSRIRLPGTSVQPDLCSWIILRTWNAWRKGEAYGKAQTPQDSDRWIIWPI